MSSNWICIEGGGTRSTFSIVNESLEEICHKDGPALHAHRVSLDTLISRTGSLIDEGLESCEYDFERIEGLGLALAGADRSAERENIQTALADAYPDLEIFITSDIRATHVGAFNDGSGILVIAGTGSIVLGRNGRKWQRAGGYGHRMGDEGSGHQIGVDGLRAVGRHYDGQRHTSLAQKLQKELDISNRDELIRWTYEADHSPSRIAPYVTECAEAGDEVCRSILNRHIGELADMVCTLTESLELPDGPVSWHGGLFEADYYRDQFQSRLESSLDSIRLISPQYNPRIGVCLMAKNKR